MSKGMFEFIILAICLIVYLIYRWWKEFQFNCYDMEKVDDKLMTRDKFVNGLSATQIRRNTVKGKYDKK